MKREELMINDMVFDYTNSPVKVCAVGQDIVVKNSFRIGSLEPNELSPIPLTEEILVKNGFEFKRHEFKTINDDYWISDDKRIIFRGEHMTNSFNKWSVHVDTEDMRTMAYLEITYVHQLQRLLNLCNIDKEIIL